MRRGQLANRTLPGDRVVVTETWRLLMEPAAPGAHNMAVDEALLMAAIRSGPPTMRFYAWQPACLSLGHFQDVSSVDIPRCLALGIDVVRRPTGGRAVLHADEVTYSVTLPPGHHLNAIGVTESYRLLNQGFACAMRRLGVRAELVRGTTNESPRQGVATLRTACFDSPSWQELVGGGRKFVGSAQVRRLGALLQHGSIPLTLDAQLLYSLFRFDSDDERKRAVAHLKRHATGLNELGHGAFSPPRVVTAVIAGMEEALDVRLVPAELDSREQDEAAALLAKHSGNAWVVSRKG